MIELSLTTETLRCYLCAWTWFKNLILTSTQASELFLMELHDRNS